MSIFSDLRSSPSFSKQRLSFHFSFLALLLTISTFVLRAEAQDPEPLFLEGNVGERSLLNHHSAPSAKRSRLVQLNPRLLTETSSNFLQPMRRFAFNLFPDEQLTAVTVQVDVLGADRYLVSGYIESQPNGTFTLALDQETMAATISLPGRGTYTITRDGEFHIINEIDFAKIGACGVDGSAVIKPPATSRYSQVGLQSMFSTIPPELAALTNAVSIVDVMVLYTAEALAGAGSVAGMNTLIDLAVAEANTVYQNSRVNTRIRLVYRGAITNYIEATSLATNLNRLQLKNDGFLDEVHALRDTNRADLVCLITEHADSGVAGLAFTMGEPSMSFADRAFSVVQRSQAVGRFIFAHEISHNFGCQHDRENALDETGKLKTGSFPYSYGHRFTADGVLYRTVMAYAPGEPIPYLSNPDVLFKGVSTGIPGITNGANNALTINNSATIVGTFHGPAVRTAIPTVKLTSPTNNLVISSGTNLILNAQAGDSDGPLRQVELYADNMLVGIATNSLLGITNLLFGSTNTFSVVWSNVPPGEYRLTARAVDLLGASSATAATRLTVRPANDNFGGRTVITGVSPAVKGSNRAGTLEDGEAMHSGNPGGHSVWYSWTAPKSGTLTMTVTGQGIVPLGEAYQSISTNALSSVTRRIDFDNTNFVVRVTFDAISGQTYALAVDSLSDSSGDFTLALDYIQPPQNDDFANRANISGEAIDFEGVNLAATSEPSEGKHAQNTGGKSIWYSWTAPKSRPVVISVEATNFFPLADVYLGTSLPQLTNAPQRTVSFGKTNQSTTLAFTAVAGQTYAIAVDGFAGASGLFHFTLNYPPSPVNDDFANRVTLNGTTVTLDTSTAYSTKEPGEPLHAGQATGKASIWYSWTAPVSGPVIVTARGDGFYPLPDAYTGSAINSLTNVPGRSLNFDKTDPISTLVFDAVALRTYALAIDGFSGASGKVSFSLATVNSPPSVRLFDSSSTTNVGFRLRLFGSPGQRFLVQASVDLTGWSNVFAGTFVTNSLPFTDDNSRSFPRRFYRALPLP